MGRFRSDNRGGGFEGRSGGSRYGGGGRERGGRGGFGGGRGRDSERRPLEMHEAICAKCGRKCEVPFRPTGNKPVYCRDCFNKDGDSDRDNFGPRNRERSFSSGGEVSSAQLNQINAKLDKIIKALALDSDEE